MHKQDLIKKFKDEFNVSNNYEATDMINFIFDEITKEIFEGSDGKILLTDFGSFNRVDRPACTRRNPQNNEPVQVPAKRVIRFKPSRNMVRLS